MRWWNLDQCPPPQPGERFVDIGCGAVGTTLEVGRCVEPDGSVLGIDLSAPMLATARGRAQQERLSNVQFVRADAAGYPLEPGSVDGILSRFG